MQPERPSTRLVLNLDRGWRFVRRRTGRRWAAGGGQDGRDARTVDLPHCWNLTDTFAEGARYYRGPGGYRLTFRGPSPEPAGPGRTWRLVSDGFYGTGDVWLNGRRLGSVDGQYLGFELDPGNALRFDADNLLAVRLTNRCASHVLPGIRDPDFLLYGGLSGRVRLEGLPGTHLDADTLCVRCRDVSVNRARVDLAYGVVFRGPRDADAKVVWRLAGPDGAVAGSVEQGLRPPARGGRLDGGASIDIREPRLWSPDEPALYVAEAELLVGECVVDRVAVRFGVREARFVPGKGFFLNGSRLELCGANRHEDMPGFGRALPDSAHVNDVRLMREAGLNFVRLSHYPQSPAFLDACDAQGLCVYAEIASWKSVRRGRWLKAAQRQMSAMIRRDRNHPSIVLWGMGNEARDRTAYRRLRALAGGLDPTRPVIYAENHLYRARRRGTVGLPDVWGLNYELDALPEAREASRLRVVVVSECSNAPAARRGDAEREAEQVVKLERDLAVMGIPAAARQQPGAGCGREYVAGFAMWCFGDYATERKQRFRRFCGMVDAWRLPKACHVFLRALYDRKLFVAVRGPWGEGYAAPGSPRRIHVYTNAEQIKLLAGNDERWSGRGAPHVVCEVSALCADLRVRVKRGAETCEALLPWHGEAVGLRVDDDPDWVRVPGDRTKAFRVRAVDDRGRTVRSWNGPVRIKVAGAARLRSWRADDLLEVRGGEARGFCDVQDCEDHPEVEATWVQQ